MTPPLHRRPTDRHPAWKIGELLATAAVLLAVGHHDAAEHLAATGLHLDALDLVYVTLGGKLALDGFRLTKG